MENISTLELQSRSRTQFLVTWIVLSALGLGVAYLLSSLQFFQVLAGALFPQISQGAANWVYLLLVVLSAVIIGVAQWFALRGWLGEAHWWLAATALGWLFIFMISSSAVSAFSTAVSNRDPTLATFMFLLSFAGHGLVVGLPQWLALRLEHPHSRSWVGWSTLGTAASTLIVFLPLILYQIDPSQTGIILQLVTAESRPDLLQLGILGLLQGAIAAAVSGIGLLKIYNRPAGRWESEAQINPWRRFLLYWSLVTLLALFINSYFAPNFLSFWSAIQSDPNLRNLVIGLFSGVVVGILQWLVLRDHYKNAFLWILVTGLGYAFTGLNQQLVTALYPDTSFLALGSFGDVFRSITYLLASSLGLWVILGVLQSAVLTLWLGRRAWVWVLAVPAIMAVGLLASLIVWGPIASVVQAVGSGLWLIYLVRSGLLEEAYFAPQTATAPSADELDLAAQILQERMVEAWEIQGRTSVDSGRLKVEVGNVDDVDAASDLALQQGHAVIFKASGPLEDGSRLPEDAEVVLTEEDLESTESADTEMGGRPGLEIKLTEAGREKLAQAWKKTNELSLGLALDSEVIAAFDVTTPDANGIYLIQPFSLDADFLAAILGNDPLPFPLKVAELEELEEDEEDEEEEGEEEQEEESSRD